MSALQVAFPSPRSAAARPKDEDATVVFGPAPDADSGQKAVNGSRTAGDHMADRNAGAIREAVDQGEHVTSDQFKAGLAEVRAEISALDTRLSTQIAELRTEQHTGMAGVRTEIANLETRLMRWMVGTVIATATLTVGILRVIG